MVLIVKTKNNHDALKAIEIVKDTLKKIPYKTKKQKQKHVKQMKDINTLTKKVKTLKNRGFQVKQLAF